MKKTLIMSNSWRPPGVEPDCAECGIKIEYSWGDYSFRYYEKKDKSDIRVLCKSCASRLKNTDKTIRVVQGSPIMDMINLMNSGWKPQPERKLKSWNGTASGGSGFSEVDSDDEKDGQG
jgi:hypothetical protein